MKTYRAQSALCTRYSNKWRSSNEGTIYNIRDLWLVHHWLLLSFSCKHYSLTSQQRKDCVLNTVFSPWRQMTKLLSATTESDPKTVFREWFSRTSVGTRQTNVTTYYVQNNLAHSHIHSATPEQTQNTQD